MTRTSLPGWPALNRGADEPGSRKNLIRNRPERAARPCLLQPQLGRRVRSDTAAYASGPARGDRGQAVSLASNDSAESDPSRSSRVRDSVPRRGSINGIFLIVVFPTSNSTEVQLPA